jgi:hypothetical protein
MKEEKLMLAMKKTMGTQYLSKMKKENKKALSTVVATVLLILLTVVAVTVVWVFINNFIKDKTDASCYQVETNLELVSLNEYYTCFNDTSDEVQFSINIGDVEIDELLISILADGATKSVILTNNDTDVPNVRYYKSTPSDVKLPAKNAGLTYHVGGFTGDKVDWIKIAPTVNGKACAATDTILEIVNCNMLAN